ncbi:MAG: hypothetical protein K5754_14560, partial [Butyrivibrio sp.]|nr:hypothetical protein [Butyrivibrio sp.]
NSLLKKFMAELICLGQFLIFGRMIYNKASDVVNAKSDVNFIMVHGTKDEEVRIGSTALISRDFANTNVRKILAYNEGVNTHMGVIRNDKGSKPDVNQKILDEIISTLG